MIQAFQGGMDIRKSHLKGIYLCMVGKDYKKVPSDLKTVVICTMREGEEDDSESCLEPHSSSSSSSVPCAPITISCQNQHFTLRPWFPECCRLAAAIRKGLICFPIRPKSTVFALNCSLRTLSHVSDTVGPKGRLIGVLRKDMACPQELIQAFTQKHPNTTVVTEDIQSATLERYERMLSLPTSSRYAFLMALHPRLGAKSPARLLHENPRRLCRIIFDFLECTDAALVRSLVVWHWPENQSQSDSQALLDHEAQVGEAREIVLNHIDILHRWRKPRDSIAGIPRPKVSETDGSEQKEKMWVFLDMCLGSAQEGDRDDDVKRKENRNENGVTFEDDEKCVTQVQELSEDEKTARDLKTVQGMKWLANGHRTGLVAKEQLDLAPWWPNHSLLLLKYDRYKDEPRKRVAKANMSKSEEGSAAEPGEHPVCQPPAACAMPVPAFVGSSAPGPSKTVSSGILEPAAATPVLARVGQPSGKAVQPPSNTDLKAVTSDVLEPVGLGAIGLPPGLAAPPGLSSTDSGQDVLRASDLPGWGRPDGNLAPSLGGLQGLGPLPGMTHPLSGATSAAMGLTPGQMLTGFSTGPGFDGMSNSADETFGGMPQALGVAMPSGPWQGGFLGAYEGVPEPWQVAGGSWQPPGPLMENDPRQFGSHASYAGRGKGKGGKGSNGQRRQQGSTGQSNKMSAPLQSSAGRGRGIDR
eukprot:TRINITY_DN21825_c0_g1_i2.p1 TRINITY_DN21825_c0_g1~~TRINITY_DN21825_c0_g1_i2.p1  ORF type:complete len:705 (-),score=113.73 TRINITY_DN21825_c0_g1_i2:48-2138(-)